MTRQKKSRKPQPLGPKQDKKQKTKASNTDDKRVRKHKGHGAGSRNNPETLVDGNKSGNNQSKTNSDPRHGSNKPISLTPVKAQDQAVEVVKQATPVQDFSPKAKLEKVKPDTLAPEQELQAIEEDERLLSLLERKENDELITGKDAKYFNAKMARHQELMEILGLDDEEDENNDGDDDDYDSSEGRSLIDQWEDDDWDVDEDEQ